MILTMPPSPTPSSRPAHDSAHERVRDRTGLLLAIGSVGLFSLKVVVVKLGLADGLTVETLMVWRMLLALPVYVVVGIAAFRRARTTTLPTPAPRTFAAAAALGVLSYYVCTWLDFSGMRYISAQLERLILFTYPALTAVLAWAMLGERFTRRHAASLGLSYAGVLLVFGAEAGSAGPHAALGVGLVFAAALLFAFYVVLAKPVIAALGSQRFTCVAMIAATAAILTHRVILSAAAPAGTGTAWVTPTAIGYGAVLAVFCTVVPSFMLSEAIARIGAGRTSAAGNIGPVVTAGAAVFVLNEPFGPAQAGGLVLITLGVGLLAKK